MRKQKIGQRRVKAGQPKAANKDAGSMRADRPTIIDVAHAAVVSPATVSNTLNNRTHVDEATRARVLKAVENLGYTPNLRARRLRTGRADSIAIFTSTPFAIAGGRARLGFTMEIAAAAASRALESGIALILVPPLPLGQSPFRDMHIDGAIVVEPAENDPNVALLLQRGVAVVSIGRQPGNDPVPFVDIQPYKVAKILIEHLMETTSGEIGLIVAAQSRTTHTETERAYREIVRSRKMAPRVVRIDETGGEQAGYAAACKLLTKYPKLEAIFASVDVFAVGAHKAATHMGRELPGNFKLATRYDGILARETNPPITAVNLHLDDLALAAVDLLLEHLNGNTSRSSITGPLATLVPRGSSLA